jgi:hypothetical protein
MILVGSLTPVPKRRFARRGREGGKEGEGEGKGKERLRRERKRCNTVRGSEWEQKREEYKKGRKEDMKRERRKKENSIEKFSKQNQCQQTKTVIRRI